MLRTIIVILALVPTLVFAGSNVTTREVQLQGTGSTYQAAINEALLEAIARVHGKTLNSQKIHEALEASVTDNTESEYLAIDILQNRVSELTSGTVLGFDVIESSQSPDGLWLVTVNAKVADYKRSASSDRKRISVIPFKVNQSNYVFGSTGIQGTQLAERLSALISEKLVSSRKFTILDRDYNDEVAAELTLLGGESVAKAEYARLGQSLTADYLLVGIIDNAGFSVSERKMRTSDKTILSGKGATSVSYRLIETATTQIVFSGKSTTEITDGNLSQGVRASANDIVNLMLDAVANKLSRDTVDQIFPLTIVGRVGDELIISEGNSTLKVGERYSVFQRNEKIIDPYTNELLGWAETLCCEVEISRVNSRMAYARLVKNANDLPVDIQPKKLILKAASKVASPAKRVVSEPKSSIQQDSKDW